MTGRERVKAALCFSSPDRAPRDIWPLPGMYLFQQGDLDAIEAEYPMDMTWCPLSEQQSRESLERLRRPGQYTDDWGCIWHVGEPGVIGEVKVPILKSWSGFESFQPPWRLLKGRDFSEANRCCDRSDRFMLSGMTAQPFERMQFLRGTENLYMDIAYGTAEFRRLLEMVHEYFLSEVESWCQSNVDGVFFQDDWGSNRGPLISPNVWRDLFKPLYKEYCDRIHAAGKFAMFHSDGQISSILGDLIEIGVDAVNSQLFCMDIEQFADDHKGKITFWGEIDRQHVLAFGTVQEVEAAVRRVRCLFDDGTGGVIAQCSWGPDNPIENIRAVYHSWLEPRA